MRSLTVCRRSWPLVALLLLHLPRPATAQETIFDECPPQNCCRRPWSFRVMPYLWSLQADGDLTVRGVTTDLDVSMGTFLNLFVNQINWAALGQIEATNGKVGLLFNGVYADLQPAKQIPRLAFSSDLRLAVLDCDVTYELEGLSCRLGEGSRFEVLAGVRYYSLSAGITVTGPRGNTASDSGTEDWLDPIVGARMRVPLRPCLTGTLRGDVGGFGIGEASRFSWNIEANLEYRLSQSCSLFAGYRWLDVDYTSGSGNRRFALDANLNGPVLGFAFDF